MRALAKLSNHESACETQQQKVAYLPGCGKALLSLVSVVAPDTQGSISSASKEQAVLHLIQLMQEGHTGHHFALTLALCGCFTCTLLKTNSLVTNSLSWCLVCNANTFETVPYLAYNANTFETAALPYLAYNANTCERVHPTLSPVAGCNELIGI